MTQWTNYAPSPHAKVTDKQPARNLSAVPNFVKTSGIINGTSPRSFSVTKPSAVNVKDVLNSLPTFLTIQH